MTCVFILWHVKDERRTETWITSVNVMNIQLLIIRILIACDIWCYLLRFLCLIINRFSSVGYIGAACFLSPVLRARFLFLFFSPFCFNSDPCMSPVTVSERRSGLLSLYPSFVFLLLFLFFLSGLSPLPPPLGKSADSSKISLFDGSGSLEVGTDLLGFHGFALPVLSRCLHWLCLFSLGVASLSAKNICLGLGLWFLGVRWDVALDWWLFLLWLILCFFFGGPGVRWVSDVSGI